MRGHRRRTSLNSYTSFERLKAFRRRPSQQTSTRPHFTGPGSSLSDSSGRSSGESLVGSDASNESDVALTPITQYTSSSAEDVAQQPEENKVAEVDITKTQNQHASTTFVTQDPQALSDVVGDNQSGTELIEKYCCGGGCCFLNAPPPALPSAFFTPIEQPDNDAYKSLNLRIPGLAQDTQLTGVTSYPETKLSFQKLSPTDSHHLSTVDTHPPAFVQPHPPYSVFSAPVFHARELTKPGAEKRTFHFDIDVTDYPEEGGLDFKVGGAVGVCPPNTPVFVNKIFDSLGVPRFLRDKPVTLNTQGGRWPTIWGDEAARSLLTTRRELLTWCVDIQSYPPTKALLRLLSEHATAPNEKKILEYLASAEGQRSFCELRIGPHLSLVQLLQAFPSSKPPLEDLLGVLDQLMPRFYSLSNDPHVSARREGVAGRRLIEIAVTVHESPDWEGGAPRTGVGSGFLERLARQFIDAEAAHKADPKNIPMPDFHIPLFRGLMANPLSKEFGISNGPMILIGAGVGMAPFRGFILNRLQNANCANKIWLVQGVRDSSVDELYSGELGKYESQIKKVVQSRAWMRKLKDKKPHVDNHRRSESDLATLRRDSEDASPAPVSRNIEQRDFLSRRDSNFAAGNQESRYVQDEVLQQADVVWDVIHAVDGRIFVCGSSKGMGEGVEKALRDVAKEKGGWDDKGASRFWEEQREQGRFVMEVW